MSSLNDRIDLLRSAPPALVAETCIAALPHAGPPELPGLVTLALGCGDPGAAVSVIRRLEEFTDFDALVRGSAPALPAAAKDVLRRGRPGEIETLARILRARCRAADLEAVAGVLFETPPGESAAADVGETLASIVVRILGPHGRSTLEPLASERLDDVLARLPEREALLGSRSEARDAIVLAIAIALNRPGPALQARLAAGEERLGGLLRALPRRTHDPVVRANLLRWLGVPTLARSAARALAEVDDPRARTEVFASGHLLAARHRRRALLAVDRPMRVLGRSDAIATAGIDEQRTLVRLIEILDLSPRLRTERLEAMYAAPDVVARWRAVEAARRLPARRGQPALERLATDGHPSVARVAGDALLRGASGVRGAPRLVGSQGAVESARRGGTVDRERLRALGSSASPAIRRRTFSKLASIDVDVFRRGWTSCSPPCRRALARNLNESDPTGLEALVAGGLDSIERVDRLSAIDVLRATGLVEAFESRLCELAGEADARVASAAIAALAAGRGAGRLEATVYALDHPDGRVTANAIESLLRIEPAILEEWMPELLQRDHNRVRANAALAMCSIDMVRGRSALGALLAGERPLDRISALWAYRAAGPRELDELVERIAGHDPIPAVRRRALAARAWRAARRGGMPVEPFLSDARS